MGVPRLPRSVPLLLLAALAALLAGCMGGSRDGASTRPLPDEPGTTEARDVAEATPEQDAATSAEAAATEAAVPELAPGTLIEAMSRACRTEIARIDAQHARHVRQASRTLGDRAKAQAALKRLKRQLTAAKRRSDSARVAYEDARRPLDDFLAAHPDRTLPPDEFAIYEALRDEHDAALAPYDAAMDEYNAVVDDHNATVARFNTLVRRANGLARTAEARQARWRRSAGRCLGTRAGLDAPRWRPSRTSSPPPPARGSTRRAPSTSPATRPSAWAASQASRRTPETFERAGYVTSDEDVIHLAPRVCLVLDRLLATNAPKLGCVRRELELHFPLCEPSRAEAALALTTVAHEAQHVDGVWNEAQAECYGLQTADTVATALGLAGRHGAAGRPLRARARLAAAGRTARRSAGAAARSTSSPRRRPSPSAAARIPSARRGRPVREPPPRARGRGRRWRTACGGSSAAPPSCPSRPRACCCTTPARRRTRARATTSPSSSPTSTRPRCCWRWPTTTARCVLALSEFGCIADEYDSAPWSEDGVRTTPRGGDATRIARAFAADEAAVDRVLRDRDRYEGPAPRHAALLDALGVPATPGTVGFAMLERAARDWDAAVRDALLAV